MLPDFFFCSLFPVQQTTSVIGHRVKNEFFRVGNQYAECEKQQQQLYVWSLVVSLLCDVYLGWYLRLLCFPKHFAVNTTLSIHHLSRDS